MAPAHADRCCVHPSCWDADAHASLDSAFHKQLFEIRQRTTLFKRAARIRLGLWVKKLEDAALPRHTCNLAFKKTRNAYSRLLLYSVRKGRLDYPFDGRPPEGPLPSLPTWRLATLFTGDASNPKDTFRGVPQQAPWQYSALDGQQPGVISAVEFPLQARKHALPKPGKRHAELARAAARPAADALEEILKTTGEGLAKPSVDAMLGKSSPLPDPPTAPTRLPDGRTSTSGTEKSPIALRTSNGQLSQTHVGALRSSSADAGTIGTAAVAMPSLLDGLEGLTVERPAWDTDGTHTTSDGTRRGACGFHPSHANGSKSSSSLSSSSQVGEAGLVPGARSKGPSTVSTEWADLARLQPGGLPADVEPSRSSSWLQPSGALDGLTTSSIGTRGGATGAGASVYPTAARPASAAPTFGGHGVHAVHAAARPIDDAGARSAGAASPPPSYYHSIPPPHTTPHQPSAFRLVATPPPSHYGDGGPTVPLSPMQPHASLYSPFGGAPGLSGATSRVLGAPSVGASIRLEDDADLSVLKLREENGELRWRLRRAEEAVARLEGDLVTARRHVATQAKEHAKEVRRLCRNHRREIEDLIKSSERRWREWAPGVGARTALHAASLLHPRDSPGGTDALDGDGGAWPRSVSRIAALGDDEDDAPISPSLAPRRRYSFQEQDDLHAGGEHTNGGGPHRWASLGGDRGSLGGERLMGARPRDDEGDVAGMRAARGAELAADAAPVMSPNDPFLDDFELRTKMLKLKLASRA